ncbi:MAG: rhodanese-like domain-containing protein [Bacteroidetes bacterium]|nr:rhodanese-like domain-containing protein [Bacteroidota bacterium]
MLAANILENYGLIIKGVHHISPKEAFEMCNKGFVIMDVREDYLNTFKTFDVPMVISMPFSELKNKWNEISNDIPIIFADSVGLYSHEAVDFMIAKGYSNICNMVGGIVDWEKDGLPMKINTKERLSGSCMCQLKPREK